MTPPPDLRALLFDLDGVLIDSVPPILRSMNAALLAMGRREMAPDEVRRLIGPPLEDSAALALQSDDPAHIAEFVGHFRVEYDQVHLSHTLPAAGLGEVVAELAEELQLVVATSKPEAYAAPILEHFGVARHFRAIVGRSLALDHHSKAQVVERALQHLNGVDPGSQALMIGDRSHDVVGAGAHGIRTVGVLHGMGSEAELRDAGAAWIVADLHALHSWLKS